MSEEVGDPGRLLGGVEGELMAVASAMPAAAHTSAVEAQERGDEAGGGVDLAKFRSAFGRWGRTFTIVLLLACGVALGGSATSAVACGPKSGRRIRQRCSEAECDALLAARCRAVQADDVPAKTSIRKKLPVDPPSGLTASPHLQVRVEGAEVLVHSDFLDAWRVKANGLGGRYSENAWHFHVASLALVREGLRATFGEDGTPTERTDLLWTLERDDVHKPHIEFAGRVVARRSSRDGSVQLGRDVAVVSGEFPSSSGSIKNPTVGGEGVQVRLMGVPRSLAVHVVAKIPTRASLAAPLTLPAAPAPAEPTEKRARAKPAKTAASAAR